jgi:hypothetical protein
MRSTIAPAGSDSTNHAAEPAKASSPAFAGEPVSSSTSSGYAMFPVRVPSVDNASPIQ